MNVKFFTNNGNNTLYNKLKGIFENNPHINCFDVLSGYFNISGYYRVRQLLDNTDTVRILVGIGITGFKNDAEAQGVLLNAVGDKEVQEEIETKAIKDVNNADYNRDSDEGIMQLIKDADTKKVQIKAHPSRNIHAKIYILRPQNFNEHNSGHVITGSSNITSAGLGITSTSNYEFNVLLHDYTDVQFATDEFERLWAEGVEISSQFFINIIKKTHLQDITPRELYLKTLIEYFGKEVEFDPNSITDLPKDFKRLDYQMDAVNQAYEILEKHNGCFLADVVGLGKTVVATLIARMFYQKNGYPEYRSHIVLVIPLALRNNWETTLEKFKIDDAFDIYNNGSVGKIKDLKKYDMVIIDESHKFRNHDSQSYKSMQRLCKAPTTRGTQKKVILVSATPLNNSVSDIANQVLLFQDGNNSSLGFSLTHFFNEIKRKEKEIKLHNKEEIQQKTRRLAKDLRRRIIEPLTVRRTRTDLTENKRYKKDLEQQNIIFPKIQSPQPIYYKLPDELNTLFDTTLTIINNKKKEPSKLCYIRYCAPLYLKDKSVYNQPEHITNLLVAIMRTILIKRMDSSFDAFKSTLSNFLRSSQIMMEMIQKNKIIVAPKVNIAEYALNNKLEELEAMFHSGEVSGSIFKCSDFEEGFVKGVKSDHKILQKLNEKWKEIDIDPKLDAFKEKLLSLLDEKHNPEKKLVVFTESAVTMKHLKKNLKTTRTLGIDSHNIKDNRQKLQENFDANLPQKDKKNDYDIIITTDVLAEGVNLHRSNTVINYDTPWNSTKLIQRIGRVNRIGTQASHIFIYNFFPTEKVDNVIELKKKAITKMQAFHSALGEDAQIFSEQENIETFKLFDESIQAEKSETLPYLEEIRDFKKNHPQEFSRLKDMPLKLRNAVKNEQYQTKTLTFMRTSDKNTTTFSCIDKNNELHNIAFIEAMKMLSADFDAANQPLPKHHYEQVHTAQQNFKKSVLREVNHAKHQLKLSVPDKNAIRLLKSLQNHTTDEEKKEVLNKTITTIHNKAYQNLSSDINKVATAGNTDNNIILENTLKIIQKYNIERTDHSQQKKPQSFNPAVIISQSYV